MHGRHLAALAAALLGLTLAACSGGGGGTSGGQRPGPVTQAPDPPNPDPPNPDPPAGGGGSLATVAAAGAPAFTWLAAAAPTSQARSWGESLREGGALSPVEATIADTLRGADEVLRRHTWSGVHVRGLQSDEFEAWGSWGTWSGLTNVAFAVRRDFGKTDRFSALIEGNPAEHAPVFGEWSGIVTGYTLPDDARRMPSAPPSNSSQRFVGRADLEMYVPTDGRDRSTRLRAKFSGFQNLSGGNHHVLDMALSYRDPGWREGNHPIEGVEVGADGTFSHTGNVQRPSGVPFQQGQGIYHYDRQHRIGGRFYGEPGEEEVAGFVETRWTFRRLNDRFSLGLHPEYRESRRRITSAEVADIVCNNLECEHNFFGVFGAKRTR